MVLKFFPSLQFPERHQDSPSPLFSEHLWVWANYLARERPLRAARNGRGESLGHALLKTFISGFSSE
jgi:hypothetical protein